MVEHLIEEECRLFSGIASKFLWKIENLHEPNQIVPENPAFFMKIQTAR